MSEYSIIKKGIFDSARSDFPFADQYIIARKDDKNFCSFAFSILLTKPSTASKCP